MYYIHDLFCGAFFHTASGALCYNPAHIREFAWKILHSRAKKAQILLQRYAAFMREQKWEIRRRCRCYLNKAKRRQWKNIP